MMEFSEGRYVATIENHSIGQAKTGNYQLIINIKIEGKIDPNNPEGDLLAVTQKQRTMYLTITDNTKERRMQELLSIGYTGTSWAQFDKNASGDQFASLIGKSIEVVCSANVHNGKESERWEFPSTGGGTNEGINTTEARKLDTLLGDVWKSKKPGGVLPAAKSQQQPKVQVASKDDEIPF